MIHNPKCAAMHLDMWCIKSGWLESQLNAIKAGTVIPDADRVNQNYAGDDYEVSGKTAIISLEGGLMKAWSKYGGTSTTWARAAIRHASANKKIDNIMLYVDSPGGTSAGTAELGDDIRKSKKPVHAYIDDLGASAAYWAASQADHISMNRTGLSGSIGTYMSVDDTSGAAEMEGIKVHVISTGDYKGMGAEGAEITEEQLAHLQGIVNSHFSHFESAVRGGRKMLKVQFDRVRDGRVFDAKESIKLGLVDSITSFDAALLRLQRAKKQGE